MRSTSSIAKSAGSVAARLTLPLLAGMLLTSGLGGCGTRTESSADTTSLTDQIPNNRPTVLENRDTGVRITVPPQWENASLLRGDADIYATYPSQALYASVVSENDTRIGQFGLEDNAEQYRRLIERELNDYETSTRTGVDEVNGYPAVQYEIRGQVEGVPVVYLHTTVRGTDSYYQVVGWTRRELYADNRETLQEIIASFEGS
ncbi:hypothetical protein [cf. Phormidesmis sp. LEGE 11477]|uniref:hypothetical protein n=1 Tax=cf. Phormidesmis sp. LEGE 11477 TaxID=1828680 RepID=UPI001881F778|nr:hypothetical protein [cf. Phormidesmis sp. LEGE 11477]MBE9060117.1 hypothetical protein [cf. Phormidesmis sp. LEGE 11477]